MGLSVEKWFERALTWSKYATSASDYGLFSGERPVAPIERSTFSASDRGLLRDCVEQNQGGLRSTVVFMRREVRKVPNTATIDRVRFLDGVAYRQSTETLRNR